MCCDEICLVFARARTGCVCAKCSLVCRVFDAPVVLVWSVDDLQASEGQTRMSCDPVGCVALCLTSSREFRGAVELYG